MTSKGSFRFELVFCVCHLKMHPCRLSLFGPCLQCPNVSEQLRFLMQNPTIPTSFPTVSRRQFLKNSGLAAAGAAALSQVPFGITAHAAPDDPIRIGLIGCGGRGTGAVADALGAATDVNYPAAGDHPGNIKA